VQRLHANHLRYDELRIKLLLAVKDAAHIFQNKWTGGFTLESVWEMRTLEAASCARKCKTAGQELVRSSRVFASLFAVSSNLVDDPYKSNLKRSGIKDPLTESGLLCLSYDLKIINSFIWHFLKKNVKWNSEVRQWLSAPWRGLRLFVSAWVSVGLPSCLDRALAHHTCGFLASWPPLRR
jgi:hypothetical protein